MMKQFLFIKRFFLLGIILFYGMVRADSCTTTTSGCPTIKCYSRRSDSRHKDRIMVGQMGHIDWCEQDSCYGHVALTAGYSQTFDGADKISRCLFGNDVHGDDDCQEIKVQGSAVASRTRTAWLADYFYLPRNYNGSFTIDPRIKTFHLDIDGYLSGFDTWCPGFYARIYGTLVHTNWDLHFCDNPGFEGTDQRDHDEGYFSPRVYTGSKLVQSFG